MRIQPYNSKERLPGQGPGVAISPNQAGVIGDALSNLGKTVTDVTLNYWEAQRKADRVTDYHAATTAMHRALSDLNQDLQQEPDESTYQPRFDETFNQTKSDALANIKDDETRQAISATFDDMQIEGSGAIQKMTWVRKAQKGKAKLLNDLDYWKNAGDLDRVKTIIRDGQESMLIDPVEAEEMDKRNEYDIWVSRARNDIAANPYKFVMSKYPLPDATLHQLQNEARIETERRQSLADRAKAKVQDENQSRALDMYYAGTLTPAYLSTLHKVRALDDQAYEHFMAALSKKGGISGEQTDLFTYAELKEKASKGTLTSPDVLKNISKLTEGDAKGLINDLLVAPTQKDTPLAQEKASWRDYVKAIAFPESLKDMSEEAQTKAVQTMVAYDRGVANLKTGEVEQFAKTLTASAQKEWLNVRIGEWIGGKVFDASQGYTGAANYPETPLSKPESTKYELRPDGTVKGPGWIGTLKRPDGKVSTELSVGVNFDGQERLIPLLVPTLSKAEVDLLLKGKPATAAIMTKAVDHAKKQIELGQGIFAPLIVTGVPAEYVNEIAKYLSDHGQPITEANIQAVYDHAHPGGK